MKVWLRWLECQASATVSVPKGCVYFHKDMSTMEVTNPVSLLLVNKIRSSNVLICPTNSQKSKDIKYTIIETADIPIWEENMFGILP